MQMKIWGSNTEDENTGMKNLEDEKIMDDEFIKKLKDENIMDDKLIENNKKLPGKQFQVNCILKTLNCV